MDASSSLLGNGGKEWSEHHPKEHVQDQKITSKMVKNVTNRGIPQCSQVNSSTTLSILNDIGIDQEKVEEFEDAQTT